MIRTKMIEQAGSRRPVTRTNTQPSVIQQLWGLDALVGREAGRVQEARVVQRLDPPAGAFDVLLVEDDDDDITLTTRVLARGGLTEHPRVARDGHSALILLIAEGLTQQRQSPIADLPDVILLDLGLPKIPGVQVLQRIKDSAPLSDIPVIVLSGSDDESTARFCMDTGASMYIVKPISLVDVMNIVVTIEKHWLASENFRQSWRLAA